MTIGKIPTTGLSRPAFLMAAHTLSFDSLTNASGNPIISKQGILLAISTSTVIIIPLRLTVVASKLYAYT
jgi:hypothetical protein